MTENEIARIVVDACFHIHKELGPGLLENIYEEVLSYELRKRGVFVERQVPLPVYYDGIEMKIGFRADLVVAEKVIIEIKSVEALAPVHFKVLLTYLKISDKKLGLLINFNESLIKNGIRRVANNL